MRSRTIQSEAGEASEGQLSQGDKAELMEGLSSRKWSTRSMILLDQHFQIPQRQQTRRRSLARNQTTPR
jgi:hypothetical protein